MRSVHTTCSLLRPALSNRVHDVYAPLTCGRPPYLELCVHIPKLGSWSLWPVPCKQQLITWSAPLVSCEIRHYQLAEFVYSAPLVSTICVNLFTPRGVFLMGREPSLCPCVIHVHTYSTLYNVSFGKKSCSEGRAVIFGTIFKTFCLRFNVKCHIKRTSCRSPLLGYHVSRCCVCISASTT
jgi:hypothetical protein